LSRTVFGAQLYAADNSASWTGRKIPALFSFGKYFMPRHGGYKWNFLKVYRQFGLRLRRKKREVYSPSGLAELPLFIFGL